MAQWRVRSSITGVGFFIELINTSNLRARGAPRATSRRPAIPNLYLTSPRSAATLVLMPNTKGNRRSTPQPLRIHNQNRCRIFVVPSPPPWAPRGRQGTPGAPQRAPRGPQETPRGLQEGPRGPKRPIDPSIDRSIDLSIDRSIHRSIDRGPNQKNRR